MTFAWPDERIEIVRVLAATDLPADQSPFACTLAELNDETCRWPLGDPQSPDFRFCGAKPDGMPYCRRHAHIAYNRGRAA